MRIKKVFIASPLFNEKERQLNDEIDLILKNAGYETFLPQRDGFLKADIIARLKSEFKQIDADKLASQLIYPLDMYMAAKGCHATVLNLNGRVPDEGGLIEATLTFSHGKPLVIYKTDYRSLIFGKDNPLIEGLGNFNYVERLEDIPIKLRQIDSGVSNYSKTMQLGKKIAQARASSDKSLDSLIEIARAYINKLI